ncbi:hypothetical protein ACWD6N_03440 [Micromonospora sp. NPDC005163]
MGTVATTNSLTPLIWPSTTLIDRSPRTGHLFAMVKATAADTYELRRSTDGGANWSTLTSVVRANVQEIGSLLIPSDGMIYWCFRTAESSQDRVYFQRFYLGPPLQIGPQILLASAGNEGAAGSVYTGLDIQSAASGTNRYVVVAMGTTVGATHGVVLVGATINARGQHTASNVMLTGTRWWFATGSGRITPSMEIEHVGDSKSGYPAHLWVTWGRTDVYIAKLAYSNGAWAGPVSPVRVNPATLAAQDHIAGRWDGHRFMVATPDPTATDRVQILERNRANSVTSVRQTPAHPAGNIRNCTLSYDRSGDTRVYAVGTSSTVLYFVDRVRATGVWTSWAQVSATAILGTTGNNYSVRRSTYGNARYDVLTAHAGSPNTIVSTPQVVSYPPDTPAWDTVAIGIDNGAAANVSAPVNLQWTFTDPDPVDIQSAWALSRQIGAGTIQYLRASDNTWQPAEVKNTGMSITRSLAAGWGVTSDAPHSYKIKVWDSTANGSAYSDALVLVPSGKVNPVITSPVEGGTVTTDTVTTAWTVAEQTQYRVKLIIFGGVLYDSGWRGGTDTSYRIPWVVANGFNYSVQVQTRNAEGLASDVIQVNFGVAFVEPPRASLAATALPESGVIRVAISNPAPAGVDPVFVQQDLWRRPVLTPILNGNPGFEAGSTAGWGPAVGGVGAASTEQAQSGSWSYKVIPDGVSAMAYAESIKLPCVEGVTYDAYGWARAVTANKPTAVFIRWYNAGGGLVGSSITTVLPPAAGVWRARSQLAAAPAGATQMTLCAGVGSTPAVTDIVYVDELRIRVADPNDGVRIAAGLPSGAVVDDWRAVSGIPYEYRAVVRAASGASAFGPWTA